ncbi:S9 family peptidase [Schleiferia thermophila]|uniref:Dipeptidyl-peptidase-4 n=1 Tax=Schleiferia thermophila TaxID=884107 RepID=A0A369A7Q4_9FLAO|nr:S9 family peptidase [Schleiferia thermophila]RCX05175.1 dipeptidyl-peptidase-4 [Schleiferia thermophila]GCD79310.1 peptidase S9 [Schleiferia thermophila]
MKITTVRSSIALLVIAFSVPAVSQKKEITIEDIWLKGAFVASNYRAGASLNDGQHYSLMVMTPSGVSLVRNRYSDGKTVDTLVSAAKLSQLNGGPLQFSSYEFSADESLVLLATSEVPIYRHSSKAIYYIYDLINNRLQKLSDTEYQRLAFFNPVKNLVAFVFDNDLYFKDFSTGEQTRITADGKKNEIINGATDWVYEEEFGFDRGHYWSEKGNFLAYYRFDESEVPVFGMDVFGTGLYPTREEFKYPKAGEKNSDVQVYIYQLNTRQSIPVILPGQYEYIPRIKWTPDDATLMVYAMNRHQNVLDIYLVNATTGKAEKIFSETDKAYVDVNDNIRFISKDAFIWTSERNGYNHLYLVEKRGKKISPITKGNWDVTDFYGYEPQSGTLYFQASVNHPGRTEVYSIQLNGKNLKRLTPDDGTNTASFSKTFHYFIHTYSKAGQPPVIVMRNKTGALVRTLTDNEHLVGKLSAFQLSQTEFFSFKTSENLELHGWMIKPADFDPNKKYPVLLYVYGGPGAQTVIDRYDPANHFWHQMLAQKGIIVVSVDNRGTGHRGAEFKKATYLQLGKLELLDQIETAKYLSTLPFVDKERIGIWGWSFGGYLSSLAITKGADYFKLAIAVAPVTHWKFYDTIYTERYLRTPRENPSGYDDNSPALFANKLRGKYLIIHGTADDNVHYQNAMYMTERLVQANKDFEMMMYPDKNHGIYGGYTRLHLYRKMTDFILNNL